MHTQNHPQGPLPPLPPLSSVVESDADRLGGAPVFKGGRVPLRTLFDYLKAGKSVQEFLADFDGVTAEQVQVVLEAAAADVLRDVEAA